MAVGSVAEKRVSTSGLSSALPWSVALVALMSLVALVAGQRFGRETASSLDAPLNALPQEGLDGVPGSGQQRLRAADISRMTPRERADRLFNIIMELDERGKTDSVRFFAQMAIPAHQMLDDIDVDVRYHIGRISQAAGISPFGADQADTILQANPTHLLGLLLAAQSARAASNETMAREFESRLLNAAASERRKDLLEYRHHRNDIDRALETARNPPK